MFQYHSKVEDDREVRFQDWEKELKSLSCQLLVMRGQFGAQNWKRKELEMQPYEFDQDDVENVLANAGLLHG